MAYNPALYYPQNYQPFPAYQQIQQPQMLPTQMSGANQQMMTPPTIHAEIVQVDGEQAAAAYPVGAGASQMMMARDDSAIYVKTATANGFVLDVYERRVKSAQNAVFDPDQYVRRDEVEKLVTGILAAQSAMKRGKREEIDNEPV